MKCMGDLFDVEPMGWGLRGDPYLWKEMKEHFASTCLPNSKSELESLVSNAFKELTGHQISETSSSMSKGLLTVACPQEWWHQTIGKTKLFHIYGTQLTMKIPCGCFEI